MGDSYTVGTVQEHGYSFIGNIVYEILRDKVGEFYAREKCGAKFLDDDGNILGRGDSLFAAVSFLDDGNLTKLLERLGVENNLNTYKAVLRNLNPLI